MSIYYFTLEHLSYPFLFFGMALALWQLSEDVGSGAKTPIVGWLGMLKKLLSEMKAIWIAIAIVLGIYISTKVVMTAIGWIALKINRPYLFGELVPPIDWRVGVGSIFVVLVALVRVGRIIYRIKLSKRKRTKDTIKEQPNDRWFRSEIL